MTGKLLIVDDEKVALRNLEHVMKKEGHAVTATQSGANALSLLGKERFDVVLTDLRMEKADGMQILRRSKEISPDTEVILITGHATLESAIEAMKHGAFHYVSKPFRLDEVRQVVAEALEKVRLKRENQALRQEIESYQGKVRIITQNPAMRQLMEMARQVAPTDCNVLITGESGTGKELFARYLHANSQRAEGPFIAINCGAFNEDLLANELFGHERGAFTGATAGKQGLLEAASGGTLFLDEITEMSPPMQVKLLRVIQEREILPLGSTQAVKIDTRFISATNRRPQDALTNGRLRQDLYYRLNVVTLDIPPLSQRKEDIPLLAVFFMQKYALLMKKTITALSQEAQELLLHYDYPGNVRELENAIEHSVALANGETINTPQLPESIRRLEMLGFRRQCDGRIPTLEEQEKAYIQWVLDKVGGNQTLAAQTLGINRVSLWRKLKQKEYQ
ncbi:MAG: sigma-54-dependent transcriptional regulator [Sulfuricellaceae bacterium]|jgi:two-component system response regulator HydG